MTEPSYEDYIDRLNDIPGQTIPVLHQIRNLDKQVLALHINIQKKRDWALQRLQQHQAKPSIKSKSDVAELLREIGALHEAMMSLSRKKMRLSEQVYNSIDVPTEEMNRDLASRAKTLEPEEAKTSKYKRPSKHNQQEYCAAEPLYCYCRRPSFGLMVKCESDLCEVEWFHRDCLQEKALADKWFCRECRKTRPKNPKIRI